MKDLPRAGRPTKTITNRSAPVLALPVNCRLCLCLFVVIWYSSITSKTKKKRQGEGLDKKKWTTCQNWHRIDCIIVLIDQLSWCFLRTRTTQKQGGKWKSSFILLKYYLFEPFSHDGSLYLFVDISFIIVIFRVRRGCSRTIGGNLIFWFHDTVYPTPKENSVLRRKFAHELLLLWWMCVVKEGVS